MQTDREFPQTYGLPPMVLLYWGYRGIRQSEFPREESGFMDFNRIDSILEDYREKGYYPSAVCEIFDKEKTLYHKAFGDAAPDTWFDLA